LTEIAGVSSLKTGSSVVKPVINGLFGSRVPINNNVRLEDQEWGTDMHQIDVNAAGKITVIKGASGLQFGGDAVGGLIIIEPFRLKKTLFWENYSKSSVKWQRRFHELKSTQRNDKDGVGMHWEQSSIWETKKHPDMSCLTQGIEKLFWRYKIHWKKTGCFCLLQLLLQLDFECFTYGECERPILLLIIP
jgi:hypothetical protein